MIGNLTKVPTRTTRTVSAVTAGGILFVVVAFVPRLADQIGELQERDGSGGAELQASLGLDTEIDQQLTAAVAEFNGLQATMISADQLPSVQNELLVIARECDCQIRRVAIQSGWAETWQPEKDRTEVAVQPEVPNELMENDDYNLQTELILLSLSGTFEQISRFAQQVRGKPWLCSFSRMSISRLPDEKGRLSMEATIAFSRLSRKGNSEFIDWQSTPSKPTIQ